MTSFRLDNTGYFSAYNRSNWEQHFFEFNARFWRRNFWYTMRFPFLAGILHHLLQLQTRFRIGYFPDTLSALHCCKQPIFIDCNLSVRFCWVCIEDQRYKCVWLKVFIKSRDTQTLYRIPCPSISKYPYEIYGLKFRCPVACDLDYVLISFWICSSSMAIGLLELSRSFRAKFSRLNHLWTVLVAKAPTLLY